MLRSSFIVANFLLLNCQSSISDVKHLRRNNTIKGLSRTWQPGSDFISENTLKHDLTKNSFRNLCN